MDTRAILSQIPVSHTPSCAGEELFLDRMRGKLSEETYQVLNAAWVSENLHEYAPERYMSLSQPLQEYIDARIGNRRETDEALGQRLGTWVAVVVRTLDKNDADLSLIRWSLAKCESKNIVTSVERLKRAVKAYELNGFPKQDFQRAMRVQVLDALARAGKREAK